MFKYGAKSMERLRTVDTDLIRVAKRALEIASHAKIGIDFLIPPYGGKRSTEDQQELFLDGKSMCDGVNNKSLHQSGRALDFAAYVNGKASWDKEHLLTIATCMLQAANELNINIEWGGLWKNFLDMPHIQLK